MGDDQNGEFMFPPETAFMTYITEGMLEGVPIWTLHDCDGVAVMITDNRSSAFFFAMECDCSVVVRH